MENHKYPTQKDLGKLWWFRMGQVLKYFVILLALFIPSLTGGLWYLDGVISAFLWYVILKILWLVIKYVIYGKAPITKEINDEKKQSISIFVFLSLLIGTYLFAMYAALSTHLPL